ncbi:uncharacterized protein [Phaseolus vulgaris]|uniref:uncharacterized protein n=1 Tax=Phaseolus vulgaris TaxID=3885 RepID=UPI0035C9BCE7
MPAPQRKKLVLRKPKRKTPQVVQEDEDDEVTEDGLVTKRTRVAPSLPPALPTPTPPSPPSPTPPVQATPLAVALPVVEGSEPNFIENPPSASTPFVSAGEGPPSITSIVGAAPGGDEGAHNSPILITESPTSPPRQEAPLALPTQEGGGESQHQAPSASPPTTVASLPPSIEEVWGPFTAKLKMMAEDLPSILTKAVKSSNKKLQDGISMLQEENRLIRIEAEKLSCNLMMAEIDHSRLEDAMSAELRGARKEASDLRQKLHLLAQEKIELEKTLRLYAKNDDLCIKVDKLKKELASRDEEMAQQKEELAKLKEELARKDELFQQTKDELTNDVADSYAAGFEDAMAQVACVHPGVDLSQTGLNKTIANGQLVNAE